MILKLKNILFSVFFLSLLAQGTANQYHTPAAQNHSGSVVFQETWPLPDIENEADATGILQCLKLTERNIAEHNSSKLSKKQCANSSVLNFFAHSPGYFRSYYSRHINSLSLLPLFITTRRLII